MVFVCLISIFCVSVSLTGGARWFIHRRSTLSGIPDFLSVCGYLSLFDSRKNVLKYFSSVMSKNSDLISSISPWPVEIQSSSSWSFVLAGVSQLELCFFWSLQLDRFTANPSHIYIYEEYFGIYNWFVFWVACIFSVCVFLVVRPQATLSLTHISVL